MICNTKDILFSVIVTAYNCEKYILETLESIYYQTLKNLEVIIVEDDSSDNTHKIISNYIENKSNWKLYSNDINKGVVYSRNKAFSLAQGKYIAILDGDDVWEEEKLEKQHRLLCNNKDLGFCYTSYSFINEDSQQIEFIYNTKQRATYHSLLKENYIGCSTVAFKTDISKRIKMNHDVAHEDYYYWLTMLKNDVKAKGIIEPLVKYRIHDKSRSYNKLNAAKDRFNIYYRFEKLGITKSIYNFILYTYKALYKYIKYYIAKKQARGS